MAGTQDDRSPPDTRDGDRADHERTEPARKKDGRTSVELSERGGIRPEETDPSRQHDRSRDRSIL